MLSHCFHLIFFLFDLCAGIKLQTFFAKFEYIQISWKFSTFTSSENRNLLGITGGSRVPNQGEKALLDSFECDLGA